MMAEDSSGVHILLRRFKTDILGKQVWITVKASDNKLVCPVAVI